MRCLESVPPNNMPFCWTATDIFTYLSPPPFLCFPVDSRGVPTITLAENEQRVGLSECRCLLTLSATAVNLKMSRLLSEKKGRHYSYFISYQRNLPADVLARGRSADDHDI